MAKKITAAEIKDLKAALKALQDLQDDLGHSTSAAAYMKDIQQTNTDIGGLIDGAGAKVSKYVDARTTTISAGLTTAGTGVTTAINLLSSTITNYENNEKTHAGAADGTGNGGGKTGANGGGNARGEG